MIHHIAAYTSRGRGADRRARRFIPHYPSVSLRPRCSRRGGLRRGGGRRCGAGDWGWRLARLVACGGGAACLVLFLGFLRWGGVQQGCGGGATVTSCSREERADLPPPAQPLDHLLQLAPLSRKVNLQSLREVTRESSSLLGVARSRWRHGFGWPHPRPRRPSCAALPWACRPSRAVCEAEQSQPATGVASEPSRRL